MLKEKVGRKARMGTRYDTRCSVTKGKLTKQPVVDAPIEDIKSGDTANSILDPAKMQEMLNPQTMQLYLSQVSSFSFP